MCVRARVLHVCVCVSMYIYIIYIYIHTYVYTAASNAPGTHRRETSERAWAGSCLRLRTRKRVERACHSSTAPPL